MRVTRASSPSPASGSGRWLIRPAAKSASADASANGSLRASARTSAARAAAGLRACLGEHLGSQVGGDDGAVRADGLAKGGQRPAGAAADVDDHAAAADAGPGDRGGVGGHVVAEPRVPGGGPGGEERAGLGEVPGAAACERGRDAADHRPVLVVQVDDDVAPFSPAPSGSRPARIQIITSQVRAPRQPGPPASLTAPSTASPPVSASSMPVSRTHGRPLAVSVAASRAASAAGCSPHPSTSTDTGPAGISPARPHSISSHRRLALAGADGDGTGVSGDGMRP